MRASWRVRAPRALASVAPAKYRDRRRYANIASSAYVASQCSPA